MNANNTVASRRLWMHVKTMLWAYRSVHRKLLESNSKLPTVTTSPDDVPEEAADLLPPVTLLIRRSSQVLVYLPLCFFSLVLCFLKLFLFFNYFYYHLSLALQYSCFFLSLKDICVIFLFYVLLLSSFTFT